MRDTEVRSSLMSEVRNVELQVSASGIEETIEQFHEVRDAANEAAVAAERLSDALEACPSRLSGDDLSELDGWGLSGVTSPTTGDE